ncbi:LacI family DNA-binding transcriptional regulator [Micrococcales bacterium 31B]|nr:LacI family DNA-binding transcriptional regulator [Micrococcales bacterium 31B]
MTTTGRPPTIHEVAREAGVSHQTVSRYLRGGAMGMKPATVTRVSDALAALQYTPNLAARSLRSAKRLRLAAVVSEAPERMPLRVLQGASAAARAAGYSLEVVYLRDGSDAAGHELAAHVRLGQYAGVLALVPLPEAAVDTLPDGAPGLGGAPLHGAGTYDAELKASGVLADGGMAERIVEYLADLGHRVFFHVAGDQGWASARNRLHRYRGAIARLGLESAGEAVGDWSAASGYRAAQDVPERVTAVIAANDPMAWGVIRALHERGRDVPDDVSVTGWDDVPEAAFSVPSLTTVSMDLEAEGRRALVALLDAIDPEARARAVAWGGHETPADSPRMRLRVRESTAPPRR